MSSLVGVTIDKVRLSAELAALARITDAEPVAHGTAVTRVVFTERDRDARAWLKQLAREAGLPVREDAVGNTFFTWPGREPHLPAVGTGSHIDAIPHAGMYDGTVGVLGGLEAIRSLQRAGFRPARSIDLLLFTSEEPTRFGIGCLGSRLLSGALPPEHAGKLRDEESRTLDEVRASAGFTGSLHSVPLPHGHYSAWVELHIEQGPLLEQAGVPLGMVTAIAAPASYHFTIEGLGGHAGALLMPDRRDALCAAAELILAIERSTLATGAIDTVATVGTCAVYPGAVNSVPSRVVLQLDVRDTDPERRESVMRSVRDEIRRIAQLRQVTIHEGQINADNPAHASPTILNAIAEVCTGLGVRVQPMVSRAYHDTLFLARLAPVAMLFIPCRGGVSHRPDEFAEPEHIALGTQVLAETLARLAWA